MENPMHNSKSAAPRTITFGAPSCLRGLYESKPIELAGNHFIDDLIVGSERIGDTPISGMTLSVNETFDDRPLAKFFDAWLNLSKPDPLTRTDHIYEREFYYSTETIGGKKRKRFCMTEGIFTYVYKNRRQYKRLHHMRPYLAYPVCHTVESSTVTVKCDGSDVELKANGMRIANLKDLGSATEITFTLECLNNGQHLDN